MTGTSIAALAAAAIATLSATSTASGFQAIQTFKNAQVTVPSGTTAGGAANIFCTNRGFSNASAYDLRRLVKTTSGMNGMAVFNSVSCRSYLPVVSTGGALVTP